jgi:hypothetical protein
VTDQTDLGVSGDGAHGIGNLADAHVQKATRIVDWYHASQDKWRAAATIDGETSARRIPWARQQLDALWDGRVADVRAALEPYRANGAGVPDALSDVTTHQRRMDDPACRARGLPVGSGTVGSARKHRVSARLTLAGMIRDVPGAEAVAVIRAWLTSDRWNDALRLHPPPQRPYRRQAAAATTS